MVLMIKELIFQYSMQLFVLWIIGIVILLVLNKSYANRKKYKQYKRHQEEAKRFEDENRNNKARYPQENNNYVQPNQQQDLGYQNYNNQQNNVSQTNYAINGKMIHPYHESNVQKLQSLYNSSILCVDNMTGIEFENFLHYMFVSMGYEVIQTPPTYDFGADLIICKDGKKTVVQAKQYGRNAKYAGKLTGIDSVQQTAAAKEFYHADSSMVVTSSYFTMSAIHLARANHTELWDRDRMVEEFHLTEDTNFKNDLFHSICPACGDRVFVKYGKRGSFIGCNNYPRCTYSRDCDDQHLTFNLDLAASNEIYRKINNPNNGNMT